MFNLNDNFFKDFRLINGTIKLFRYRQILKRNPDVIKKAIDEDISGDWDNELLEIPEQFLKFDGEMFQGSMSDLLLYINRPEQYVISKNKKILTNTDYQSIRNSSQILLKILEDPDISNKLPKELLDNFLSTEMDRQSLRDQINQLEVKDD